MESEREKLLHMEDELHKRVIGQEQAIAAISDKLYPRHYPALKQRYGICLLYTSPSPRD